jgi:hypothetical protein
MTALILIALALSLLSPTPSKSIYLKDRKVYQFFVPNVPLRLPKHLIPKKRISKGNIAIGTFFVLTITYFVWGIFFR